MDLLSSISPLSGAYPLAHTTQDARRCALSLARTIDAKIDPRAAAGVPELDGYLCLPEADVAITATSAPRPNWSYECQHDARASGHDIVLMYFDRTRGVSVDILSPDASETLYRYLLWNLHGQSLWFIPSAGFMPFIRATKWGLTREVEPPFGSDADRAAGIITAATHRSFKESC